MTINHAPDETSVSISRAIRDTPAAALYTLNVAVTPAASLVGRVATLSLIFPRTSESFQADVSLSAEPFSFWLAINTHLLPDGENRIEVRLASGDACLHSESFSLSVLNDGSLTEAVRSSLTHSGAPLVYRDNVGAELFDTAAESLRPWYERPDALERIQLQLASGAVDAGEAADLTSLVENGYVQLGWTVDQSLIDDANAAIDDAISIKYQGYEYGSSQRIELLHDRYDAIRSLWKHPGVLRFLRLVFDAEPLPCQTLVYVFGSEQDLHQDTIHLTSFPPGYMCGVWIALQDIEENSGELNVVPKSHRLGRVYRKSVGCAPVKDGNWNAFAASVGARWSEMYRDSGLPVETYRPKAGSVLVWLDNLLHGGSKRVDKSLTRRSVVSHYFASGSIAYYDSTGLPGYVYR
jgi:hypothetical protein